MYVHHTITESEHGRTALMLGAANGHTAVVQTLIHKGVPYRVRDKICRTPLHVAGTEQRLAYALLSARKEAHLIFVRV